MPTIGLISDMRSLFMSQTSSIELTEQQREVLLKGLRYVRSSLMLDIRDPSPRLDRQRAEELDQIAALAQHLSSSPASPEPAEVS